MFKSLSLATSFSEDEVLMIGLLLCFFFSFTKLVLGRPVTQKPNQGKFSLISKTSFLFLSKNDKKFICFYQPCVEQHSGKCRPSEEQVEGR